jgi:MFS superfamily sulfate permease-like transporter
LFFANVERILGSTLRLIRHSPAPIHSVILSLEESPDLDGTSIEALQDFFVRVRVRGEGMQLVLARLKDAAQSALAVLPEVAGTQVILSDLSVDGAVQQALKACA